MTTIVKHRRTGNEYILLGITGEVNKTNPSRFISELFNQDKSEVSCSATVCDAQGNMFLAYIDDLVVTEIDGQKLGEILPQPSYESVSNDPSQPPYTELEDEEFEEEFEEESEPAVAPITSEASFLEGLGSPIQSKTDDDDDDWV